MIEPDGADVLIRVKAVPGASRDEIAGTVGGRLKVRVSAPPEGGRANTAVCRVIADSLGVRPRQVSIESGRTSAHKTIRVADCGVADVSNLVG
jgi:uncharacterized protein (TIGR00251 family)